MLRLKCFNDIMYVVVHLIYLFIADTKFIV